MAQQDLKRDEGVPCIESGDVFAYLEGGFLLHEQEEIKKIILKCGQTSQNKELCAKKFLYFDKREIQLNYPSNMKSKIRNELNSYFNAPYFMMEKYKKEKGNLSGFTVAYEQL